MDGTTVLALGSLLVAGAGAWNSFRKTRVDDRTATGADLQALNKVYLAEITRLRAMIEELERECRDQAAGMQKQLDSAQRTIVQQANRISDLEVRGQSSTRTRSGDASDE